MRFTFEIGEVEKHTVSFHVNPFWGNVCIRVDEKIVIRSLQLFSHSLIKTYNFTVGSAEPHEVEIEKERKLFFAGFRKQKYRAYVDNHLIIENEGF